MYPKFFKSTIDSDDSDVVYYLTFDGKNFYDITDYENVEEEDGVCIIKMGVWRGYYKEGDDGAVDITQLSGKSGKRNIEEVSEDHGHSYEVDVGHQSELMASSREQIRSKILELTKQLTMIDEEEYCWTWKSKNYSSFTKTKLWKHWEVSIVEAFEFEEVARTWDYWGKAKSMEKILTYKRHDGVWLQINFIPEKEDTRFKIELWNEDEDIDN
jgi:hypothetical protein